MTTNVRHQDYGIVKIKYPLSPDSFLLYRKKYVYNEHETLFDGHMLTRTMHATHIQSSHNVQYLIIRTLF